MQSSTLRRQWWIGAAVGVAAGLAALAAVEASTGDAAAATSDFRVTPQQLQINQRISQAAVRRSNTSLGLLRQIQVDPRDTSKGIGVPTARIADGAITNAKLAAKSYRATITSTGTVASASTGVTASPIATGRYRVQFPVEVANCTYTTNSRTADATAARLVSAIPRLDGTTAVPREVEVRITDTAIPAVPQDGAFDLVVSC